MYHISRPCLFSLAFTHTIYLLIVEQHPASFFSSSLLVKAESRKKHDEAAHDDNDAPWQDCLLDADSPSVSSDDVCRVFPQVCNNVSLL